MPSIRTMHAGLVALALLNMLPIAEGDEAWGLLSVAAAAGILSLCLTRPDGSSRVSPIFVRCGVIASISYLVYEVFSSQGLRSDYVIDLSHFVILLGACKFFELNTNRDMGLIIIIAFLVLTIGALISGSFIFPVVIAADITFGVWWLIVFQTKREWDALLARRRATAALIGASDESFGQVATMPAVGAPVRATLTTALGLTLTAAILFVLMPRGWGRSLFGGIQQAISVAVTGFGDEVKLTDSRLFQSEAPVMRVRLVKGGQPFGGEDYLPYMRGWTMDRYHGGRWARTPSKSEEEFRTGTPAAPEPITEAFSAVSSEQLIEQHVWLGHVSNGCLFSMYPPLAFGSHDIERVQKDTEDLALQVRGRQRDAVYYVVQSAPEDMPAVAEIVDRERISNRPFRDGRSSIPRRVNQFAKQFAARFGDPTDPRQREKVALAIRDYLSGGEFHYTLQRGKLRSGVDPIEDFLFSEKRGHCEYFASAMTLLCQSVGIPARVVTGYCGGEYNAVGHFYQFRQKDAHAWVEVKLPGRGWARFDPSPPSESRTRTPPAGILAQVRRLTDFIQFEWSTFVVAYDVEHRRELMAKIASWFRELSGEKRAGDSMWAMAKAFLWGPQVLTQMQRVFYWMLLILCLAFFLLVLRVLWILSLILREFLPSGPPSGRAVVRRPEAKFYDRLLLLLANKGHAKPAHQTPREFANELSRSYTDLADVRELTEWFYEAQYGHNRLDPERWHRVKAFLQQLRENPSFGSR